MCIPIIWFPVDIPNGAQPLDGYDCFLLWFCENPRILKFLSFSAFLQVSNESLRSLSTLENLEEISMVGCLFIDDDGLQMLGAGNSLQVITLQGCRSLYDPLCILWCHFLLFIYFLCLSHFQPHLFQSIDVSRCHHVTSQGLALLIDSQRVIRKINAGHSLHVSVVPLPFALWEQMMQMHDITSEVKFTLPVVVHPLLYTCRR